MQFPDASQGVVRPEQQYVKLDVASAEVVSAVHGMKVGLRYAASWSLLSGGHWEWCLEQEKPRPCDVMKHGSFKQRRGVDARTGNSFGLDSCSGSGWVFFLDRLTSADRTKRCT